MFLHYAYNSFLPNFQCISIVTSFILKGFRNIVFIFIVISQTFWPICPPAFFRCLSNSGTFTELWITSFIKSMGVACFDSVSHNRVQVLSIPVLLLALQSGLNQKPPDDCLLRSLEENQRLSPLRHVSSRTHGINGYRRWFRPKRCGNNNKDEDNSPKTLNDKNHQSSFQKFYTTVVKSLTIYLPS